MRKAVLWIEDGATAEVRYLAIPVYNSRKYDLTIALNISDAITALQTKLFDAVIIDIRMEPGDTEPWKTLHFKAGNDKGNSRLGLKLLHSLFRKADGDIGLPFSTDKFSLIRFGLLTIESKSDLIEEFPKIEKIKYVQKSAKNSSNLLLDLIDQVVQTEFKTEV